jgi:hypothetical protein
VFVCCLFSAVCVASAACIGERRFGLPPGQKSLACVGALGLDEFCGKSKDTYPPTLRGTRVAPLPACDFGTFRILKNRAILDRYQKEGVMRVSSVIAAGLCFLAVAAPSASPAQSPKAKATKAVVGVVKQTNRWWYSTGEGFVANPPYKFFGDRLVVDKIRNPGKWIAGSGAIFGGGTLWWCYHTGWWCTKPAEAKGF